MTDATPTAQRLWRDIVARMPFMSDPLNGTHAMLCKREIAEALAAHAAQAVAEERERCARICDHEDTGDEYGVGAHYAAVKIRARAGQPGQAP